VNLATFGDVMETTELKGSDLALMLVLCYYANEKNEAWPSVRKLARNTHLSEQQTQRNLDRLIKLGYVRRTMRKGLLKLTVRTTTSSVSNGTALAPPRAATVTGDKEPVMGDKVPVTDDKNNAPLGQKFRSRVQSLPINKQLTIKLTSKLTSSQNKSKNGRRCIMSRCDEPAGEDQLHCRAHSEKLRAVPERGAPTDCCLSM
jgi:hypothetical protein